MSEGLSSPADQSAGVVASVRAEVERRGLGCLVHGVGELLALGRVVRGVLGDLVGLTRGDAPDQRAGGTADETEAGVLLETRA